MENVWREWPWKVQKAFAIQQQDIHLTAQLPQIASFGLGEH
jgi:hypothetical protein